MKIKWWMIIVILLFGVSFPLSLISCGGGGGGGRISYDGLTTQALINEENASTLALGAWYGGAIGPNIDIFGAVKTEGEISGNPFSLGVMSWSFTDVIDGLVIHSFAGSIYTGAVQQVDEIMYGSCGGFATVTGTVNDQTGSFSGSVNFADYCEEVLTINGQTNISGTVNLDTEELVRFTLTFTSLTVEDDQESLTLNGSFKADYTAFPLEVTMSYVLRNNELLKTYWLKDVKFQLVGGTDYVDIINLTGRYYDPGYGYVEISLGTTIRIYDYGYWPSSGKMVLIGAVYDSGGNTKSRLTFLSATEFLVEADTDGDGEYDDYYSGTQFWSEL